MATRKLRLARVLGAIVLAVASLAMLAPALDVSARRESPTPQQQPEPAPQKEKGILAPMRRVQPVSVAVVNFEELARAERKRAAAGVKQKEEHIEIHPPLTIPEPDEPSAVSEKSTSTSQPALKSEAGGPLIPSPGAASSFVAQLDEPQFGTGTRTIPPDTTGAVGPTRIFSTLNSNYRVQDKATGDTVADGTVSINTFWSPLNTPPPTPPLANVSGVFDPRVLYDPYNNRWIVTAVSNFNSASSSVLVGVSATSDPKGTFMLFRFVAGCAAGASGCSTNGEWADFPMLGFNKNWIAVGWNQFGSSGGSFVAGKILILDYPAIQAGSASPASSISTNTTAGTNFSMHPATTLSPTEETLYIPVHRSSGGATYHLHRITGTPAAPVLNLDPATNPKTRPGGGWIQPGGDILPQTCVGTPGTTCPTTLRKIDSIDAHIRSNVVFRNGNIWYAQTIGLPTSGLTHTAVQWTRLAPSANPTDTPNATFVDGGRVEDPNATLGRGEWYAYPSIAVNANNDVMLGFSNFSRLHFANAGYTFRAGTDAAGTMRDPVIFKQGEDYYAKTFSGSRNRWGDFSATVVDPTNDLDMWTIQQYAGTRVGSLSLTTTNDSRWGTWWASTNISVPPPSPTPTPSPPPPPANDNFANTHTVAGCNGSLNGTNFGATKEAGEPSHDPAGNPGGSSVWYQWAAPISANVTIDTVGSNFDTLLAVYTGNSVNALGSCDPTPGAVCKNDDSGGGLTSSVTFFATAGTTYRIAVDGWAGDVGNFVFNWNQSTCVTPTIFVEEGTNNLAAVDSVTFVRGPFTLADPHNFSGDQRTRILFFTNDLGFTQTSQPGVNTLSVQLNGNSLAVENVGPNAAIGGSYIVFRLPDGLAPGTYPLGVRFNTVNSTNTPDLTIVASSSGPASASVSRKTKLTTYFFFPLFDFLF